MSEIAGDVDFVLVMSVNPGFGGQTFIPRSESKLREVRALLDAAGSAAPIEIDGGVDQHNIARVVAAGARMVVAGSAIFNTPDPERATRELKAAALGAVTGRPVSTPARPFPGCACATPKPTRWGSCITRTTSCGSKSAGPICCASPAGIIARWRQRDSGCR